MAIVLLWLVGICINWLVCSVVLLVNAGTLLIPLGYSGPQLRRYIWENVLLCLVLVAAKRLAGHHICGGLCPLLVLQSCCS